MDKNGRQSDPLASSSSDPPSQKNIRDLVRELVELAASAPDRLQERVQSLSIRDQAELALRLPAPQRMELLLVAPKPMRLVRALPDADLYLTVRELGPADSLQLVNLASSGQIQHLIDLESWRRDRFDPERAGAWVAWLLEAGDPPLRRFLRTTDDELLALLLKQWMHIVQIEYEDGADVHGHGEGDAGTEQGFITPDGYSRFAPSITEHVPAIRRILQMFYVEQPDRYQRVMWLSQWELPSELEERALHWRQSRLEEHGFPTWDEALSVYAAPAGSRAHPRPPRPKDPDQLPASRRPLLSLAESTGLATAIDRLPDEDRDRVLHEIVSLANHILVADNADTGDPDAHESVLRKAGGYVNIAIEARGRNSTESLLREVPLIELFREGYASAVELQGRARRLRNEGWAAGHERALELLDAPIRDRVLGLLEPRPQYVEFDAEERVERRREFLSTSEIDETRVSLEMAEIVGDLIVERLGLDVERMFPVTPTVADPPPFSTWMLTVLAWHATREELRGEPLPTDVVADFLRNVASRRTASPHAANWALDQLMRRLESTWELGPREISVLTAFGRYALERLSAECATLDPGVPPDPRHVSCLLLA